MKKLFVSVPMRGRTEEEIRKSIEKMKAIAEAYEGEPLELIQSYDPTYVPSVKNNAIAHLGKALEKLADADLLITISDVYDFPGCYIESETAYRYGIKVIKIDSEYIIKNYYSYLREIMTPKDTPVTEEAYENIKTV